jgi:hypothetical protein
MSAPDPDQPRRREAELARQRAEAHRAAAESTAFAVAQERDEALQRVAALEEQLNAVLADGPAEPPPPELVQFGAPGGHATLTVLLGVASLPAAAGAVYLAVLDELVTLPGLVASGATLLLALAARRTGGPTTEVSIRRGTVTVTRPEGVQRVDLTSPAMVAEVVGSPGARGIAGCCSYAGPSRR